MQESTSSMDKDFSTDYVVVTRLGDYWVDKEKAKSVSQGLSDRSGMTLLDCGYVSMSQVYGVLNREGYERYQHKERGEWECKLGGWHSKFKDCDCNTREPKISPVELKALMGKLSR